MKIQSECPPRNDRPGYPGLTPEQNKEYYDFSDALAFWQDHNHGVGISFGWTSSGKFLVVITLGPRSAVLNPERDIERGALWSKLDDAVETFRSKPKPPSRPSAVSAKASEDEWDW